MSTLRAAWVEGIVDEHTLVWGLGLEEWLPVRNVRALPSLIRNFETVFLTWFKRVTYMAPQHSVRKMSKLSEMRNNIRKTKGPDVELPKEVPQMKLIKTGIEMDDKNFPVALPLSSMSLAIPVSQTAP
eukprot:CAMPEP_0196572352 /NCGR_PEP_ID=MMETSP1081-20130531/2422_1 /TAXON_ID=36882 /ORGANISM="Pyramimonas amylifera, Strain CCMP720" /LENGTH=127 /DNA_ID=CAMNT_0041889649 /DNA_START=332 /DNA_END=718 /DNA_ORIENTATION=+